MESLDRPVTQYRNSYIIDSGYEAENKAGHKTNVINLDVFSVKSYYLFL